MLAVVIWLHISPLSVSSVRACADTTTDCSTAQTLSAVSTGISESAATLMPGTAKVWKPCFGHHHFVRIAGVDGKAYVPTVAVSVSRV